VLDQAGPGLALVTGATGFIGGRLVRELQAAGHPVRGLSRTPPPTTPWLVAGDLSDTAALAAACAGVDTIYHCAGYAHAFHAQRAEEAECHWAVNHQGVVNLLAAARQAGVRRFVFLSSVKAMGEPGSGPVDETWARPPDSDYGRAKRAAEEAVLASGLDCVVLRPAMVYGHGGRGNLERMVRFVERGWFPPLPETGNHRSLIHVSDVVALMQKVAADPRAWGQTFIASHGEAPSGRQLYAALRAALGKPPLAWAVPAWCLGVAARLGGWGERLTGRRLPFNPEVRSRLLDSAWYSPARLERELGWSARVSLVEGLAEMLGGSPPARAEFRESAHGE